MRRAAPLPPRRPGPSAPFSMAGGRLRRARGRQCFVNFELRLQELTLLVGPNGAGKTSVLDVVYALRRLLEGASRVADRDVFPPSSLTRWRERPIQLFEVEVELDGDVFVYRLEVGHDRRERRARIRLETLSDMGGPLFEFKRGDVQLYRDHHSEGPQLHE